VIIAKEKHTTRDRHTEREGKLSQEIQKSLVLTYNSPEISHNPIIHSIT